MMHLPVDENGLCLTCDCCVDIVYQERLARIETEVAEEEARQREEAVYKKQRIDVAEQRRNAPVDDSKMVDEMFGFVDQSSDLTGSAPSAFKVCDLHVYWRFLITGFILSLIHI